MKPLNFELSQWITFIAGIYLMAISGTTYMFSTYSQDLKVHFDYKTEQLNTISTFMNAGTWAGIFGGLFYDRFGVRLTCIGGALLIGAGYIMMYLATAGVIVVNHWIFALFALTVGQGSSWTYCAAISTSCKNFKNEYRGKVVGSLVCFFGLSASLWSTMYILFKDGNGGHHLETYFLVLGIVLPSITIFCMFLSNQTNKRHDIDWRITYTLVMGIVTAIYVGVGNLVDDYMGKYQFLLCIGLLVLFLSYSGILFRLRGAFRTIRTLGDSIHTFSESDDARPSMTVWQTLKDPTFYMLYLSFFGIIGSGIVIVNNISAILISKEDVANNGQYTQAELPYFSIVQSLVVLFSVFNTFGRMSIGYLSDVLIYRVHRVYWLVICALIMLSAHIYFALCTIPMMYGGVVLLGLAYGGTFCILPTLVSELYGMDNFGTLWGVIGTAPALGSELLNAILAGKLADYYQNKESVCILKADGTCSDQCLGPDCFRFTSYLMAALCLFSASMALLLRSRTQRLAKQRPIN